MAADITGHWMTFDPESRDRRSIVDIRKDNDEFRGRIVELFLRPDEPNDPICDLCPGPRGQKIRGMEILYLGAATRVGEHRGKILDPEEGRFYKCIVALDADGRRLSIHGYLGIPMFGRNVTWERVE